MISGAFVALGLLFGLLVRVPWLKRRPRAQRLFADLAAVAYVYAGGLLFSHVVAERVEVPVHPDQRYLVYCGAALPALPVALFWGRLRGYLAAAILTFLGLLALVDILTLRGIDTLPALITMNGVGNVWSVRHSISELATLQDAHVLALPLGALGMVWLARALPILSPPWGFAKLHQGLLVLACLAGLVPFALQVHDFMGTRFSWKVFRVTDWVRSGIITAHTYESLRNLRERIQSDNLSEAEVSEVASYYRQRSELADALMEGRPEHGIARDANVIIIQVEAMQQWVIDARFQGQEVTPFLNRLKRERAIYFSNIFDQAGPAATTNCEYAILASQQPLSVGATAFRRPDDHFVALPKLLRARGYDTLSAHAFHRGYWNRSRFHPALGFETSLFRRELGGGPTIGWALPDDEFLQRMFGILEQHKAPRFGFLVTLTTHHPYNYIPQRLRKLKRVIGLPTVGGYLHSMRYIDDALRHFFERFDASPMADDTLVVIYGDHDSRLRFSGPVLQNLQRGMPDQKELVKLVGERDWLADKIPVFFVLPRPAQARLSEFTHASGGRQVAMAGGQLNVAPTLLHYLGIERPRAFLGLPLVEGHKGFVAHMDGSAATSEVAFSTRRGKQAPACTDLIGKPLPETRCQGLPERAQRELSMSWSVTLSDLFERL